MVRWGRCYWAVAVLLCCVGSYYANESTIVDGMRSCVAVNYSIIWRVDRRGKGKKRENNCPRLSLRYHTHYTHGGAWGEVQASTDSTEECTICHWKKRPMVIDDPMFFNLFAPVCFVYKDLKSSVYILCPPPWQYINRCFPFLSSSFIELLCN